MTHAEKAKKMFVEDGCNCAQAVAGAFAEDFGMDLKQVLQMTSTLGGGVARMREVCGTVLGMAIVIGMAEGEFDPTNMDAKHSIYEHTQQLADKFAEHNGSIVCGELLGVKRDGSKPTDRKVVSTKRPCPYYVEYAAGLLEDYLKL